MTGPMSLVVGLLGLYGLMFVWMYFAMGREFEDARRNVQLSCMEMGLGESIGLDSNVFCPCMGERKAALLAESHIELAARRALVYGYRAYAEKVSGSAEGLAMQQCMMPANG